MTMRLLTLILAIFLALQAQLAASEALPVQVAFGQFPPYFIVKNEQRTGIAVDMIHIMNAFQNKYLFTFVDTAVMRRFYSFEQGRYNLSFFDHLRWGWDKYQVKATKVYLRGGEKYVALAKPGRGQEYFESFKGKILGGFLGYHYGLTNFNNDPKVLKDDYSMELSTTHEGNVLKIIEKRIDVAILTDAFLSRYLLQHPEQKERLLVSDIWDQQYNFSIIVRDDTSPSVEELNQLLQKMEQANALYPVWKKYGIPAAMY